MSRENLDARMEAMRDELYHPLAGIHSEEDWQEHKDRCGACAVHPSAPRAGIHQLEEQ